MEVPLMGKPVLSATYPGTMATNLFALIAIIHRTSPTYIFICIDQRTESILALPLKQRQCSALKMAAPTIKRNIFNLQKKMVF